jgi:hypothetical protein
MMALSRRRWRTAADMGARVQQYAVCVNLLHKSSIIKKFYYGNGVNN